MSENQVITIARPSDPGMQMLIEALLDGAGIRYFAKNSGVQNLFGAGQVGGFNRTVGIVQIQVSSADEEQALRVLEERMGEGLPEGIAAEGLDEKKDVDDLDSSDSDELRRFKKYSKYSAGWAVISLVGSFLSVGGFAAALAIFFGFKALKEQEEFPKGEVSTVKPIFGIVVGFLFLLVWLWLYRQIIFPH